MKKRIFSLIAALSMVISFCTFFAEAAGTSDSGNLILNGGFEAEEFSPWECVPGQYAGIEKYIAHTGDNCAVVQSYELKQRFSEAEKNKTYLASAWVKPSVDDMRVAMLVKNVNHKADNSDYWALDGSVLIERYNADKWHYIEHLVTTPETTEDLELYFSGYTQGDDWDQQNTKIFYVDDVYFGEIIPAAILNGEDIIEADYTAKTFNYSISIGNSQGGTKGVEATDVSGTLDIDENAKSKGITFENGVLTLPAKIGPIDITFTGSVSGVVNGEQQSFELNKVVKVIGYDLRGNRLVNGSFETAGTSGWVYYYSQSIPPKIVSDDSKISGNYSLYTNGSITQQTYLEPDTYYYLSTTFKPDTATFFAYNILDETNNKQLIANNGGGYNNTDTYERTYVFKTLENTSNVNFGFTGYEVAWNDFGFYTIDDIELKKYSVDGTINGKRVINNRISGTSANYSVSTIDTLGRSLGVSSVAWSLEEAPEGVTINESTGELTIAQGVENCTFTVNANILAIAEIWTAENTTSYQEIETVATIEVTVNAYDPYGNLVENGDFESGTAEGWSENENSQIVTDNVKSGTYANKDIGGLEQTVAVEANSYYITSLNIAADNDTGFVTMNIWDDTIPHPTEDKAGYWKIDNAFNMTAADGWHNALKVIKTGERTENLKIVFAGYSLSPWDYSYVYVDDIYMAKLNFYNTINGEDIIKAGSESAYTNDLKNNLGSNAGIGATSKNTWEIVGSPEGISVDENGTVTVSETATVKEFTLKLTSETNIKAFTDETVSNSSLEVETDDIITSVATKTISVVPLISFENSTFKADFATADSDKDCQYIVAFYNGDNLVSTAIKYDKTFDIDFDSALCDNVKVFTWNIATLAPLRNEILTLNLK